MGIVLRLLWIFRCLAPHTVVMGLKLLRRMALGLGLCVALSSSPQHKSDEQFQFPEHYREWVYLSSGFDMSYSPETGGASHHLFDNVFVNPEAYQAFLSTGKWPDKTVLVLEIRGAESRGSINQAGHFQSDSVMGVEVHTKDSARFNGGWAFFGFDNRKTAKMIPLSASCYSCHAKSGAVDTTFVQFYPTLTAIAKSKGTFLNAAK